MAVYKNYYNRKSFGNSSSSMVVVSCCLLYLLCSTISSSLVRGERVRHHHMRIDDEDDYQQQQLEKSSIEESSKTPIIGCPDCQTGRSIKLENDMLRLEAIKRQILSKLGLRQKPNVTHSLPREVVLATLSRAEDSSDFFSNFDREEDFSTTSARTSTMDSMDYDDFYGRTSEIISFAEQGSRVNQNRLLEFRASAESGQLGQEFRVRSATLWLKAEIRPGSLSKCTKTKIYVFKIKSNNLPESVTLVTHQFQRITSTPLIVTLDESNPGWQKIDLTEVVRMWLKESSRETLKLLVDCSCCTKWHIHLFNNDFDKKANQNRPFLVIQTDPNTAKRVRRRALDCSADSGNQCCKQRFYVSFKALRWDDWIIAPQGYYANYCRGDCGHHRTPDTYVTYHTHVIEEARKTQHLAGMQPCCAPLKFSSMSLIYYGQDSTIIKRDLPKMVVDECGCP